MLFQENLRLIIKYSVLSSLIMLNLESIAFSQPIMVEGWINTETKKSFYKKSQNGVVGETSGFQITKKFNTFKSNLAINYSEKKILTFDRSFFEYKIRNSVLGVGKINRNWSFSPNTSLILSSNARPSDSIYFLTNRNESDNSLLSWTKLSSFEIFNSALSNSSGIQNAMLLGIRAVFKPTYNLEFELVKTSQWGGNGNPKTLSALLNSIFGNTNDTKHSNINQLAGFGFSYSYPFENKTIRTYTQFVGEDEADIRKNKLSYLSPLAKSLLGSMIGDEIVWTKADGSHPVIIEEIKYI